MKNEHSLEQLMDDFISGKMSAKEASDFQSALTKDPALKGDLEFQQDVIDSIKEHRKIELKTKLSQIPVNTGMTLTQKIGIAAMTIIASSLIGVGIYSQVQEDPQAQAPKNLQIEHTATSETESVASSRPEIKEATDLGAEVNSPDLVEEVTMASEQEETVLAADVESEDQVVTADLEESILPFDDNDDSDELIIHSEEEDNSKDLYVGNKEASNIEPKSLNYQKGKMLYSYDGKGVELILDDNQDKKYRLINLTSNELYLFYNQKFYKMDVSKKITPLAPHEVTDPVKIKLLEPHTK